MRTLLYRSICFSGSPSKTSGPSLPIVAKLGLGHREEVPGLRVVEAVSFAGHGPGDPRPLEREPAGGHPVLPARPMRKRRLLRLRVRSSSPSSRTALSAVLSAMRMPAALRNVSATRRYPYLNRDFSHIPAMAGRSAACLSEGGSPRGGNRRSAASR